MIIGAGGATGALLLRPEKRRMKQHRHAIPQRAAIPMPTITPMLAPMLKANSENEEPFDVEFVEFELPEPLSNVDVGSWTSKFTPGWNTTAVVGVGHAVVPILLTLCQSPIKDVAAGGSGTLMSPCASRTNCWPAVMLNSW